MLRKQTAYKFRTKKNLIFDYLEQGHHPYDLFFIVGDERIGCHKLILSMSSNSHILDSSMDTIILPDFMPSTVSAFVKYFYSGETYLTDKKTLNEFLVLCEIFKFNVNGIEVTDMKQEVIEESCSDQQTVEMLNEDGNDEMQEMFETIDDMVVIGAEEEHVEGAEDEYDESSDTTGTFDHQNFTTMTTTTNLQGTLKDIKSKRLNLIQNTKFDHSQGSHSSNADHSNLNPSKRNKNNKSNR